MTELGRGPPRNVPFKGIPFSLLVSNTLTARADWDVPRECTCEGFDLAALSSLLTFSGGSSANGGGHDSRDDIQDLEL